MNKQASNQRTLSSTFHKFRVVYIQHLSYVGMGHRLVGTQKNNFKLFYSSSSLCQNKNNNSSNEFEIQIPFTFDFTFTLTIKSPVSVVVRNERLETAAAAAGHVTAARLKSEHSEHENVQEGGSARNPRTTRHSHSHTVLLRQTSITLTHTKTR